MILKDDNPLLKQVSQPVTEFDEDLVTLVKNLMEICIAGRGIGISAVQCGVLKRICLVSDDGKTFHVLINPEIIKHSKDRSPSWEGCLSKPGSLFEVLRYNSVIVKAQGLGGNEFELHAEGLLSFCCQHEEDHLNARLIWDIGKKIR